MAFKHPRPDFEIARRALDLLGAPRSPWVIRSSVDHDVTVIGGGQSGVAIAFELSRIGIQRVGTYDAAPEGRSNWNSVARMKVLRTPKTISGLELGIPELTFQAWFEMKHGRGTFASLDRIATSDWSDYVEWIKTIRDVPVKYQYRLIDVERVDDHFSLTFQHGGERPRVTTRKLVLATGIDGLGAPVVPDFVRALPKRLWSHTSESIDFASLSGKQIAVLGAGSSAFDNAAVALERGAASADLFCRHESLAIQHNETPVTLITDLTIASHFAYLPDSLRWDIVTRTRRRGVVPAAAVERAKAQANFALHCGYEWESAQVSPGGVRVTSGAVTREFDHLLVATGYRVNMGDRPELDRIMPHIARWSDRYGPARGEHRQTWGQFPYLDDGLAFTQRLPGAAPWVRDIHVFNYAAILSQGFHVGDISSASVCVPRLVEAVAKDLFLAHSIEHLGALVPRAQT